MTFLPILPMDGKNAYGFFVKDNDWGNDRDRCNNELAHYDIGYRHVTKL